MKYLIAALALWLATHALAGPEEDKAALSVVVRIRTEDGVGSGVIMSTQKAGRQYLAKIITNCHVVTGNSRVQIDWFNEARVGDVGNTSVGIVLRCDRKLDLAVVQVRIPAALPTAAVDLSPLHAFDNVTSIGSGLGFQPFPTGGMISLPEVTIKGHDVILHSAMIAPGNSGGGLFRYYHDRWLLVGINAAVMSETGSSDSKVYHMAVAIPVRIVEKFLK